MARITMQVPLTVTVDWPDKVPVNADALRDIAASACPKVFDIDLNGHVDTDKDSVWWVRVWTESHYSDVEFVEGFEPMLTPTSQPTTPQGENK